MSISSSSKKELSLRFAERVRFDEPLAPMLAYAVGGPADILIFPSVEADLVWIAEFAKRENFPITIVGKGTNLLVRDEGIRGITLSLEHAFKGIELVSADSKKAVVRCGGGVEKPSLLKWAIEQGFTGLEFSAGVPGTIGGGIFMNAGTKYGSYGNILREIRMFDFLQGAVQFKTDPSLFGYREQKLVKDTLVLWTEFELETGSRPAIQTEVDRIIAERAAKQPLDFPSCGSTFKNPEGHSAGRLIEKSGLKGLTVGDAQISEKHANFILNKGNAKASDILELIKIAKAIVKDKFSVDLECEVIILGE